MASAGMEWAWKGCWDYGEALAAQRSRRDARMRGEVEDVLWLLEHPPVITTGKRPVPGLNAVPGWTVYQTERGGLATCHEPGQLVGYLLMDASALGPKRLVDTLEQALIEWLATQGVIAARRQGFHRVWTGNQKIAALGLNFERGHTLHGFAINLCNNLQGFQWIVPCGIVDSGVTSLERLTGKTLPPEAAAPSVAAVVVAALDGLRPIR